LRKEYFGGLVFKKDTGNIIDVDVDRKAFILLQLLEQNPEIFRKKLTFC